MNGLRSYALLWGTNGYRPLASPFPPLMVSVCAKNYKVTKKKLATEKKNLGSMSDLKFRGG